jgi:hypothetical protein
MGGSNGAFDAGSNQVASPYFISGRSGVLATITAGQAIARLAQLGMIDPRLSTTLQPTPIKVSQIRMKYAPRSSPTAGAIFEVFKGVAIPAVGGTGAADHVPQRRKTSGYPPITAAETVLRVAGTDALTATGFTPDDATGPLDWVSVGIADVTTGKCIWIPSDSIPLTLEAGQGLEVRAAVDQTGTGILGFAVDFLR